MTLAFTVGIGLNSAFVVAEVVAGLLAGSVSLLADAAHNIGDVAGLLVALGAAMLARRQPSGRHTYGWGKATVLAAVINATLILLAVGGVTWEAIGRLASPGEVHAETVIWVAALGVVINGVSAWLFHGDHEHDANLRGAFLHLAADAAVSLAVVIGGVAMLTTGATWVDPAMSILVSLVIVWSTWALLRDASSMAMDAAPPEIDVVSVRERMLADEDVVEILDLHVWNMSTTDVALTAHVSVEDVQCGPEAVHRLTRMLEAEFHIHHCTIQVRPAGTQPLCEYQGLAMPAQ